VHDAPGEPSSAASLLRIRSEPIVLHARPQPS
jgi:hypothetical protein